MYNPPVSLGRLLLMSSCVLALAGGCFKDASSNLESGTSTGGGTTGGGCVQGEPGCDCYPNATCNAPLACEDGKCVTQGCTKGSFNCGCFEDMCFDPLVCVDGICKTSGGTGGGTGTGDTGVGGCMSVEDCDDDLCTVGDQLCNEQCVAGGLVACPENSICDPTGGSCVCAVGFVSCEDGCIPDTQCCNDEDCPGGETCDPEANQCQCDGGLLCDGTCLLDAVCCPGDATTNGCTCGAQKTCNAVGQWSGCSGGNTSPECSAGQSKSCGNCGTQNCTAQCTWSTCGGGGVCTPGTESCTAECKYEVCSDGCFWQQQGTCC